MPFAYPIALELAGRRCVVVGGGPVGERKARGLLAAGARVVVVAETAGPGLEELAASGHLELQRRRYAPGDLAGAFVAVAATEDGATNARVFAEAEEAGVLLNAVDDPEHSHFAVPAMVRRDDLVVTVSTGGRAPALASRLRRELEQRFGPEWGQVVTLLGEARQDARAGQSVDLEDWAGRWELALDQDLAGLVRRGQVDEARELVRACLAEGRPPGRPAGRVALVGAGPGDPGLITVRGRELLDEADVVVYDRLVDPSLVEGKQARYVGKEPGRHPVPQAEINALLVELARGGNRVVRLKGGDPFVFGRGAEEAEALVAEGVEIEVVPAPTSAVAALAAAGIPVTDRRAGSSFAVVSGHCTGGEVDWRGLAGAVDTIVILMGFGRLEQIACGLVDAGLPASHPAAAVARATMAGQRVVTAPLGGLAAAVAEAGLESPVTIVVGEVVRLRDRLLPGS